ncbi:Serine palmitoyltransferase [Ectocarpus siliculosus]|uniref:serine C-palmitoyltransferase n=1 Tax=Ectocarpus siliculosus TaxID=2880 RepID=D8LL73_ECTSI|nr:Serine palmitoyltransferase [Ectocarpus siliculosus]|eukprot:CBN76133.1 Serine palmitoyltransferase [Ectocarpus siliculosus]
MTTYFTFIAVICMGHLRDFVGKVFRRSRYLDDFQAKEGYAPLFKSFENFFTRRLYHRIQHCWNRPVCSSPGAHIEVIERESKDGMKTLQRTDRTKRMLNLGSYNYLGFADDWGATCRSGVMPVLDTLPVACSINRKDFGTTSSHVELEQLVARFLGKEDCVVFNMGYGTNATTIPALCSAGTLVVSDCLNHMSIVSGCRAAGAHIRVFKHNDAEDLESVLREAIVMGMPRTRRPWKKVLVVVEGIYSMEGEVADLAPIVKVAKKHKAYVYLDEAHSIGALGKTGRGACEYCGVDTKDVDVMMGTFTKSFGGMGGYIAGSKELINHLRTRCAGIVYHNALSPVVAAQVVTALRIIMGEDGTDIGATKLRALRENSNFVRRKLEDMGMHVLGDYNSPVIPALIYVPAKLSAFSKDCYDRGMAVVVVGFPATPLLAGRTRICISAGHSREDLEYAVEKLDEVAEKCFLRYGRNAMGS